jgi:PAS domain S-box-containing protein
VPFSHVFWLFGAFILGCGTTHLMEVVVLWWPHYPLAGLVKAFTAAVSLATAAMLVPIVPRALALRTPAELEHEITARQEAEDKLRVAHADLERQVRERTLALQESELRHRLLVELNPDAILIHDGSRILYANPAAARLFARDGPEALLGRSPLDLVHADYQALVRRHWLNALTTGRQVPTIEQPWLRADGSVVIVEVTAYRLPVQGPPQLEVLVRDVTERRRSEERFRLAVEAAPNGMLLVGRDGTISLVNARIEQQFGYPAAELIGRPVEVLVPVRFRASHPEYRMAFFTAPQMRSMSGSRDLSGLRKDGSEFPVEIGLQPIQMVDGLFVLASVLDVSHRRRAEEALRQAHDQLEQKVADRTAELARVNARLQKSLEEKEVLLKEIHHRVKNNLQIISSLLELQSGHLPPGESVEKLRESRDRVHSMALVHEQLYRSRDLAQVDLSGYVASLADHLAQTYAVNHRAIEIHLDISPAVRLPIDSAVPFGLLLNELVSNSLKHAFPGRDAGEVRMQLLPGDGHILLTVADNGIGLPETVDQHAATTFGLQLVGMLVRQLRGAVEIDRNGGTAFRIRFAPAHPQTQMRGEP